jgi:hypothetical protein
MANEIEIRVTSSNASRGTFNQVERDAQRLGQVLQRTFGATFNQISREARRGGEETREEMRRAFQGMADDAEDAGEDAGERLWRGADGRLRDARGRFAAEGRAAGEAFGDGVEDGAERGRSGLGRLTGAASGLLERFREMLAPAAAAGLGIAAVGTTAVTAAPLLVPVATGLADIGSAAASAAPALLAGKVGVKILALSFTEMFKEGSAALLALAPLQKGFQAAGQEGSKAASRGIRPLAEELRRVAQPHLNRYFVELGESVNIVERGFLSWAKSTDGVRTLNGILDPLSGSMKKLAPDVTEVAIAFTRMLGRIMGVSAAAGTSGLSRILDSLTEKLNSITAESVQGGFDDLVDTFHTVMDVGRTLVDWVEKIVDAYRMYTTEFRLFADAVSVAAIIFGGPLVAAVGAAGLIIRHFDEVKEAWQTLKDAFSDGEPPEIFAGFLEHSDEISENVTEIWEKIQELFGAVFADIQEWVEENGDTLRQWGDDLGQVFEDLTDIVSSALDIILELWDKFGPTLLELTEVFVGTLLRMWRGMFRILSGAFDFFAGLLSGDWERMWEGLQEVASGLGEILVGLVKGVLRLILSTFRGTWRLIGDTVSDEFDDIRKTASRALDWVLGQFKRFFGASKEAWSVGVAAIRKIWHGIQKATKDPVKFVVDVVYNSGIRPVWNFVAGIAGMKQLGKMSFRDGGIVDVRRGGTAPGFSAHDNRVGLFRDGEGVLIPEAVQSLGPNFIDAANRAGRRARDVVLGGDPSSIGMIRGFRDGGIIGRIKGAVNSGANFLKGAPGLLVDKGITTWARHMLGPALSGSAGGSGSWGQAIRTMPGTMANGFIGWVKGNLENLLGGGGDFGRALSWARTQDGKDYEWGTRDCSWFMSAIESVIRGESPHRRWATASFKGGTPPGWHQDMGSNFRVGITHAGVGHTAGTLMGVNVESSGSGGVQVGGGARGANNSMFPYHYGFRKADNGAVLAPGPNTLYNATGAPEELRPVDQIPEVHLHITLENRGVIGSRIDLEDWLTRALDSLRRQGRLADLVQEARA